MGGVMTHLTGNKMPYRNTTPPHQSGKRYMFQFHGSGSFDLKHFVNVSSTIAAAASFTASVQSSSSCLGRREPSRKHPPSHS